jgi:hypothetical protein
MSAIALFCCTENGVYISYDYFVGITQDEPPSSCVMNVFPNPVSDEATITCCFPAYQDHAAMKILDSGGSVYLDQLLEVRNGFIRVDCSHMPSGVYLVELCVNNTVRIKKMIISHE